MHFELNHKIYKIDTVLFFVLCPYFFIYGKFMCKAKHGYIEKKKIHKYFKCAPVPTVNDDKGFYELCLIQTYFVDAIICVKIQSWKEGLKTCKLF